jgi:hypothetical protein
MSAMIAEICAEARALERIPNKWNRGRALDSSVDRISYGKPVSTLPGNALKAADSGLQHRLVELVAGAKLGNTAAAAEKRDDRHSKCCGNHEACSVHSANKADGRTTIRKVHQHRQAPRSGRVFSGKTFRETYPPAEAILLLIHQRLTTSSWPTA